MRRVVASLFVVVVPVVALACTVGSESPSNPLNTSPSAPPANAPPVTPTPAPPAPRGPGGTAPSNQQQRTDAGAPTDGGAVDGSADGGDKLCTTLPASKRAVVATHDEFPDGISKISESYVADPPPAGDYELTYIEVTDTDLEVGWKLAESIRFGAPNKRVSPFSGNLVYPDFPEYNSITAGTFTLNDLPNQGLHAYDANIKLACPTAEPQQDYVSGYARIKGAAAERIVFYAVDLSTGTRYYFEKK